MSLTSLGPDAIAQKLFRYDRTHRPIASPAEVTEADIARFHRDGFLAVENVLSAGEIESAKAALSHLIAGGNPNYTRVELEDVPEGRVVAPAEREPFVRKLMYFCDHDDRLKAVADQPAFRALVERLVGSPTRMTQEMALLKPAFVGREKPWHQDTAYFVWEPLDKILGTWIALDPATPENGCMHVIPGSHRGGPQPHYHDRDCQLADESVRVQEDVMVPLRPGGAMFFSGLLHHATPPNRSPQCRRALQFHYASVHCRKMDPGRHAELFHDSAGPAGCTAGADGSRGRPVAERA